MSNSTDSAKCPHNFTNKDLDGFHLSPDSKCPFGFKQGDAGKCPRGYTRADISNFIVGAGSKCPFGFVHRPTKH